MGLHSCSFHNFAGAEAAGSSGDHTNLVIVWRKIVLPKSVLNLSHIPQLEEFLATMRRAVNAAPDWKIPVNTCRLRGQSSTLEYACYQRRTEEYTGGFGVPMARNSAKNSAKFALELRIRQIAFGSSGPTASGNLVVDRTDAGFAQDYRHPAGMLRPESEPPTLCLPSCPAGVIASSN